MRFGRSRTCSSRLNDLRARGETTVVVKKNSLPWDVRNSASNRQQSDVAGVARTPKRGATSQGTGKTCPIASEAAAGRRYCGRNCSAACSEGQAALRQTELLLELDAGAGLFELRLDRVGLVL